MHPSARYLGLAALLLALPANAAATLEPIGHEFRPTAAERAGTDGCTASDGSRIVLVFRCNAPAPDSACPNPNIGKLFAEWRTPQDALDGEPVLIAEGSYNYAIPHACSADGAIAVITDATVRVLDREGERGSSSPVCGSGSCWGPFGVASASDGFVVAWGRYQYGVMARRIDEQGEAAGQSFLIASVPPNVPIDAVDATALPASDDVLLAWKVREQGAHVRVAVLHADDTTSSSVVANEFPQIDPNGGFAVTIESADRAIVAWENEASQAGWVARRIHTGDTPVTTTTTTTTTLDPETSFLPAQDIAAPSVGSVSGSSHELLGNGTGRWFAGWFDFVTTPSGQVRGLQSATSIDDGRNWSAPQSVETEPADGWAAAHSRDGVMLHAFSREDGTGVLFRRSTDGGQSWTEPDVLYESPFPAEDWDGEHEISEVALAAGSDGRWIVAWTEYAGRYIWCSGDEEDDDCIDYEDIEVLTCALYRSISTDGGVTWSPAAIVADDVCYAWKAIELATDGNGDWLATWVTLDVVHGSHSQDDGQTWSAPRALTGEIEFRRGWNDDIVRRPHVAIAGNDDGHWLLAVSAWLPDPPEVWPYTHTRILAAHTDDVAGEWSELAGVAPWHASLDGRDAAPSLAVSEDGEFALAWSTHSAGTGMDSDIVAAFSNDGGASWSLPIPVDTEARTDPNSDYHPRIVRAGAAWGVAWLAMQGSGNRTLRFARTRGNCGNGDIDVPEQCDDANLVEGDGCDSTCRTTGCGSQVVTGSEECDDGNTIDTDACVACTLAVCGDGFVQDGVEECDDGNDVDSDECLDSCRIAVCGDGVVLPGVEECDDGDSTGNNDACLSDCSVSACGDGYIEVGEEECDDGNLDNGDGCTKHCNMVPNCGFFTSSGVRVKASDAAKVLRRAVGIVTTCPLRSCDVNGDGKVTAPDALATLRSAVGIFPAGCTWPTSMVVTLESAIKLGALQVEVSWADAAGHVLANGDGTARCSVGPSNNLTSINFQPDDGRLKLGLVSLLGIQGPIELLRCDYDPVSGPSLHDFRVDVVDASDVFTNPVEPLPLVTARME